MRTGWVVTGPFVKRFEEALAKRLNRKYVVTVNSGTTALTLALRAVGVETRTVVIVPALTFKATANAVYANGGRVLHMDVAPDTWTLNLMPVREALWHGRTAPIQAIVSVHLYGVQPPAMPAPDSMVVPFVGPTRRVFEWPLIVEDAAAGVGNVVGDVAAVSFNGNKIVTAAGGGAVCTDRQVLAERIRAWSHQQSDVDGFMFGESNLRLSNLQAAIGLAQLEQLEDFLAAKQRIAARYTAELAGDDWHPQGGRSNYWQYGGLCRDASGLVTHLRAQGIEARRLWRPLADLPIANSLYRCGVLLPCSVDLSDEDQTTVIREVKRWIASA